LTRPGTRALATWQRVRDVVPQTGHWPVLLGGDEELEYLEEGLREVSQRTIAGILRKAAKLDPVSLLTDWQQVAIENAQEAIAEFEGDDEAVAHFQGQLEQEEPFRGLPRGPWPKWGQPRDGFSIPYNILTDEPLPRVHIGLVPTQESWQVPAFLRFGGWNACPHPDVHAALMRYWHQQYGAEVVGITHDIVEMMVARPPRTRAEALALAREQYLYCEDIVEQGTQTLDVLAASLLNGHAWYFWWD
jgi:hypothetical protein